MSQFFETIRVENGELFNIEYHNARLNLTLQNVFDIYKKWDLKSIITNIPISDNTLKCRFVYNNIPLSIEFEEYFIREINSFKVVEKSIDYKYKYLNRDSFTNLKSEYPGYDDYIISQNGIITDSTFANLIFFDGKDWITPSTPLLKGTMRQYYIEKGFVIEKQIKIDEINNYKKFKLINAMLPFEVSPVRDINEITI